MTVSQKYIAYTLEKTGMKQRILAERIGVSSQQLTNAKYSDLKDDALIRLAQIAQLNPLEVLAEKHIETAKGTAEKGFWNALLNSSNAKKDIIKCILCSIQKVELKPIL
jgi:uncharacterized protein YjcR